MQIFEAELGLLAGLVDHGTINNAGQWSLIELIKLLDWVWLGDGGGPCYIFEPHFNN